MMVFDFNSMADNLFRFRKRAGLTQAEVAEHAGLSDRTYADIERGKTNMRVETLVRICTVLEITPNDILSIPRPPDESMECLLERINELRPSEKETAMQLLQVYIRSLE